MIGSASFFGVGFTAWNFIDGFFISLLGPWWWLVQIVIIVALCIGLAIVARRWLRRRERSEL